MGFWQLPGRNCPPLIVSPGCQASANLAGPGDLLAHRAEARSPIQSLEKRCRLRSDGQQNVCRCATLARRPGFLAQPIGSWARGLQVFGCRAAARLTAFTGASVTVCPN